MNSGKEILNEVPVVQAPKLVAPENGTTEVIVSDKMSISSLFEKLSNNKTYLYVVLIVIVLAIIGYYLYVKYFNMGEKKKDSKESKESKESKDSKDSKEQKNSKELKELNKSDDSKKQILNPTNEYYIIDPNGNPILVTPYFIDIMKHNMAKQNPEMQEEEEHQMPQMPQMQQMPQMPQMPQMGPPQLPPPRPQKKQDDTDSSSDDSSTDDSSQKPRPKLSYPTENIPNVMLTEAEDDNLAAQDLNNEEIVELKRQLELMKKNQNYQVTAQNDEDE
jgi:hypothetical protein